MKRSYSRPLQDCLDTLRTGIATADIVDPLTGEVIARKGQPADVDRVRWLAHMLVDLVAGVHISQFA